MTVIHLIRLGQDSAWATPVRLAELWTFGVIVVGLAYGGLVYQLSRAGYAWRLLRARPQPRPRLDRIYDGPAKSLAVLIPSYKEELGVLAQTVLSAALMEHPKKRIAVLLDDDPNGSPRDLLALAASRRLVAGLEAAFAAAARPYREELERFLERRAAKASDIRAERRILADLYGRAADWVESLRDRFETPSEHANRFFHEAILGRLADEHRARARRLPLELLGPDQVEREHRRLAALFDVRITGFERKLCETLSHAPNKAMNLNAYIGLMASGTDPRAPAADYLLTLDADSIVLPDYALRLVEIMEADPRVAVAQTPYSAFPGAARHIERIAGATTDMQYVAHQGSSAFNAAYWVGANALLRFEALMEIRTWTEERGLRMPVFIQDRTVIEDTGSTVDLIARDWKVHNHPERLAYSATPPDFGALAIQRGRWSNGGLIILPDLLRHCFGRPAGWRRLGEAFVRIHYLTSPAIVSVGLITLLFLRFDNRIATLWLPLSAAPYYFVYARDLKQHGYRLGDLMSVYALNLLLLPVNLAGVLGSVRQMLTGRKAPFARTPKVEDRTATQPQFILFQFGAMAYLATGFIMDMAHGLWLHAVFAALNATLFAYGTTVFMGWRACFDDVAATLPAPLARRAVASRGPQPQAEPPFLAPEPERSPDRKRIAA